ncbi:uncharacterized protein LY79DRAFT_535395 [Colletotrichum navitas]|uniref:Uncharacterized protein n=1 Tax=Colletotrichum navitas TaxID=681940 RepID=A0AAD8VAR8_9PEZI|nr:uncharacterized protein LY79DRAFT_535395 [Colletotrichum navitas]KAK1599539.1 hypothetical protein LY79DRAFT_535395 [Colletotrichum navitas]
MRSRVNVHIPKNTSETPCLPAPRFMLPGMPVPTQLKKQLNTLPLPPALDRPRW